MTKKYLLNILLFGGLLAILGASGFSSENRGAKDASLTGNGLEAQERAVLPITWGDTGKKLVESGVIDEEKFNLLYQKRGGMREEYRALLRGGAQEITVTEENAGFLLNLFWALGLANKNEILDSGPMQNYGDPGNFASTGGWTLARGNAMEHYSRHSLIMLTEEQQKRVAEVAKNVYRPCCGNSTHFPDCNHGMAMLGFLELMASQGKNETEMYQAALTLNRHWFPDTYAAIDAYLTMKGINSESAAPKEILGAAFSSASGYQRILSEIVPQNNQSGPSCSA